MQRILDETPLIFKTTECNYRALQLFGDNESLVSQLNLQQQIDSFSAEITDAIHALGYLWQREFINLRTADASFFAYVPR